MKLSVCIVSYNTRADLARCLDSLAATLGAIEHEIVVVDNASADGSPALVREQYPSVRLIEPGLNTFYSEGNNIAIRAARGDYVLILNPDTEVHPGAIQTLLDRLEANPGWGAVTARQIWTDGQTVLPICSRLNAYTDLWLNYTLWGALLPGWRARRRARMWYQDWDRLSDRQVEVAPGSCLLARRERLLDIGLFDAAMPLFFSDDDLCMRLATRASRSGTWRRRSSPTRRAPACARSAGWPGARPSMIWVSMRASISAVRAPRC